MLITHYTVQTNAQKENGKSVKLSQKHKDESITPAKKKRWFLHFVGLYVYLGFTKNKILQ